jgi:diguanylate cyclase (GGDEF)-like protein
MWSVYMMEDLSNKLGVAVKGNGRKKPAAQVADALLTLICDQAKEDGGPEAEKFCHRIRGYQLALYEAGAVEENLAQDCINDCAKYLGQLRALTQTWTGEFTQFIGILKDTLTERAGDHQTFHDRIVQSSDNFKKLANLDDIREVKDHLVKLARDLKQTVVDQQHEEERRNADFSKRVQDLESKLEVARREALTDPLTGIPNRAAFDRTLKAWMDHKEIFVVGMLDLDHFKSINDTHGHRIGDSALVFAAQWVRGNINPNNFFARLGGDEFAVLICDMNLVDAGKKFSEWLSEFSNRSYTCSNGSEERTIKFTMSCGLAEFGQGDTAATIIQRADEALHDAKKHRNKACMKRRSLFSGMFSR